MNVKAIQAAIKHWKNGGLAIIADDEDREAEGDLLGLASKVTPEKINFITQHARGLLCVPMAPETAKRLGITLMTADNTEPFGTAFTISVDAKSTSTGISAFDRATTIKQLANPKTAFDDFYHPGHIFPLIARPGGVKERNGHTEAAVDLARLAGEEPVAYICEILSADGHMARQPELKRLAAEYDLSFLTIKDYQSAAHHLKELGIFNLRLLTNNPDKIQQLQQYQLNIVERIPLEIPAQPYDQHYLETKKEKFHHLLKLGE